MGAWFHSGAAVVGQSHLSSSVPCQDKFQIQSSEDGEWLALVVCGGAGSARFGEYGAEITSTFFCRELVRLAKDLISRPPGQWINDYVIDCVLRVRNQLRSVAGSDNLKDYHCTLVAALVGKSGGFSIHIGDGALFGGRVSQSSDPKLLELNSSFFISEPENGEYVNETFFITEGSWVKHLRISPLPALDWIVACTDGGASLVLDGDNSVKPKFLAPFIQEQINNRFSDQFYVERILSDPKANKLTTDDKTLLLAVREGVLNSPVQLMFSSSQNGADAESATAGRAKYDESFVTKTSSDSDYGKLLEDLEAKNSAAGLVEKKKFHRPIKSRKKSIIGLSLGFFMAIVVSILIYLYFGKLLGESLAFVRGLFTSSSPSASQTSKKALPAPNISKEGFSRPPQGAASSDIESKGKAPQVADISPSK